MWAPSLSSCLPSGSQRLTVQSISRRLAPGLPSSPLAQQRRRAVGLVVKAAEEELDPQLQADLERVRQRQAAAGTTSKQQAQQAQQAPAPSGSSPLDGVKDAVDKILIADFFFVLFALGWLGVGLAERSTLQSTMLLDTWLSLWQWVFQPAIGVLMLGALVSGGVSWVRENLGGQR